MTEYVFEPNPDDHCESPKQAYEDIAILLDQLALEMGRTRATLKIYDPFYCEGSVVKILGDLGFTSVYNRNEDFYKTWKESKLPEFDCILTNPAYSSDHVEYLVTFCLCSVKPWFLLLPNYVYTKDYYQELVSNKSVFKEMVLYLCPRSRYLYTTPKVCGLY